MKILSELPAKQGVLPLAERLWGKVNKHGPRPAINPKLGPCWLWTGNLSKGGYGRILIDGKLKLVHRVAYELAVGPIAEGMEIDHRCVVKQCVNPKHLRPATRQQNAENRAARRGSASGVRGVVWNSKNGKWQAQVSRDGVNHYAGLHDSIEEAAAAAKAKRLELFTHSEIDQ